MTEKEFFEHKTKHPHQTDFKLLFYRYARYWYLFVTGVLLAILIAIFYLAYATPQYQITTSVKIRGEDRDTDYQSGSRGFRRLDVFDESTKLEDEIESLYSLSLMERVLSELDLTVSYYNTSGIRDSEIFGNDLPVRVKITDLTSKASKAEPVIELLDKQKFRLTDETTTTEYQFGQQIKTGYGTIRVIATPALASWNKEIPIKLQLHNLKELAIYYNEEISIIQVGEASNVIDISLLHPVPEKGKLILDKLVELYNRENREDRNRQAQNTIQFIDDRLRSLTGNLAGVEKNVEEFRRENQVVDPRTDAAAYQDESRIYNRQLSELNIQIDVLESLSRYLSQPGNQYELVPSNLSIDDPSLVNLVSRFNELQLERERKLRTIEPDNPLLQNINEQLVNLRQSILENLGVIRKGLLVTRSNLDQKAGSFSSRIQQSAGIERELNEINRQMGVMQDLYNFLLQKREEAALSLVATTSNTRLIDPAVSSKKPVTPNKPVLLLMALVAGLGIPFAFVFARDFLDNTVKQKSEVEHYTTLSILGEVPHQRKAKNWENYYQYNSPLSEQMGLIISNLLVESAQQKVIMVTSGHNDEGKTFFSKNLCLSLSYAGKKVVLLSLDLRNPEKLRNSARHTGITDYLKSSKLTLADILMPSGPNNDFFIINTGQEQANPIAVFADEKLGNLITELREQFDYVIIDTAPVGKVADAFMLTPWVDRSIYIIRYNYTLKAQLSSLENPVLRNKLNNLAIVLNDARKMNSHNI